MNEKATETADLVQELRNDGNSWAQPMFNRAADMIEALCTAGREPKRGYSECDADRDFARSHAIAMARQSGWCDGFKAARSTAGQEWRVPEGWRLVPEEPTAEMLAASWAATTKRQPEECYRAMLAAAPLPAPPVAEPIVADKSEVKL